MQSPQLQSGRLAAPTTLIAPQAAPETPEFDITAMVDLVFMMNIYFLVTFVTVALGEINLPDGHARRGRSTPTRRSILTVHRQPRRQERHRVPGRRREGRADHRRRASRRSRSRDAVEKGVAAGKTDVLLKAEKKVRLGDLFRIATRRRRRGREAARGRDGEGRDVMTITFPCPHCGKQLDAPTRWPASSGRARSAGRTVTVPRRVRPPRPATAATPSRAGRSTIRCC